VPEQALILWEKTAEVEFDTDSYVSVLTAIADLATISPAAQKLCDFVYDLLNGPTPQDITLDYALLNVYAKCGCDFQVVRSVFDNIYCRHGTPTVVGWNILISALARRRLGLMAISTFDQMISEGVKPDYVTMGALLTACLYSGFAERCVEYFDSMHDKYIILFYFIFYCCFFFFDMKKISQLTFLICLVQYQLCVSKVAWTLLKS